LLTGQKKFVTSSIDSALLKKHKFYHLSFRTTQLYTSSILAFIKFCYMFLLFVSTNFR